MCSVSFLSSNQTYKSLSINFKFHQGKFHFFTSRQLTSSYCHLHTYKWLLSPTGSLAYCTQQLFPTQLLLCLAWLWGRWKLSLRAVFQKARRKKNHKALIKPWRRLEILLSSFSTVSSWDTDNQRVTFTASTDPGTHDPNWNLTEGFHALHHSLC